MLFKRVFANVSGTPYEGMIRLYKVEHASEWKQLKDHEGSPSLDNKLVVAIIEKLYGELGRAITSR